MKSFFKGAFFLMVSFNLQAQYVATTNAQAQAIKERILLVGLAEENKSESSQYNDQPKNLEGYKTSIAGKNQALRKAISQYWTFSTEVIFLPLSEAQKLMRKEKEKYALLHFEDSWGNNSWVYSDNKIDRQAPFAWKKKDSVLTYDINARYNIENLVVSSLVIDLPKKAVEVYLPVGYPTEGDLICALKEMQYILDYALVPQHNVHQLYRVSSTKDSILQHKTLLIDTRYLSNKLKKEEIGNYYRFPYEVSNFNTIEKAIKEMNPSTAVAVLCRCDPSYSIHKIIDTATGAIYYFGTFYTFEIGDHQGIYSTSVTVYGITGSQLVKYCGNKE